MTEETGEPVERTGQRLVAFYDAKPLRGADQVGVEQLPLARTSKFELSAPAVAKVVYVTHPRYERRLVPFADYEEELARDKLNEALRVFTALGASRIVATVNRRASSNAEVRLWLPNGNGRLRGGRRSSWEVAFDHRGTGGLARDPRPLRYPEEPGLDAACEGVLRLGGQRYRIDITRTSQYGVDGELGSRLKRAGFKLGVGGSRTQSSQFVIQAVFGPDAASELDAVVQAASPEAVTSFRRFVGRRRLHSHEGDQ